MLHIFEQNMHLQIIPSSINNVLKNVNIVKKRFSTFCNMHKKWQNSENRSSECVYFLVSY